MKLIIILLFISSIILFFSFSEAYAEDDHEIPEWLKTIALWWVNDKVDDIEFVTAIQYLIKDKIIILPETAQQSEYPRWLTNNAGLWATKIFTNSDFNFDPEYVKKKFIPVGKVQTMMDVLKKNTIPMVFVVMNLKKKNQMIRTEYLQ